MEVLHGEVTDLIVMTQVTSTWRIGQRQVRFQIAAGFASHPMITECDEVVVAGHQKASGIFEALAYRNLTTGISGSVTNAAFALIGALILAVAGLFCVWWAFQSRGICVAVPAVFALLWFGGSAWLFKVGKDVAGAEGLCRTWVATLN